MLDNLEPISVCVPAYNEEKNIGKCLISISNQKEVMIDEILVGINSSTDKTRDIIEDHARQDDRLRIIDSPKGKANAWNALNNAARHRLRIFQDGDTTASPLTYRKLLDTLNGNDIVGASLERCSNGKSLLVRIINFPSKYVRPYPLLNGALYLMDYKRMKTLLHERSNHVSMPSEIINDDLFLQIHTDRIIVPHNIFVKIEAADGIKREINRFRRIEKGMHQLQERYPDLYEKWQINTGRNCSKMHTLMYAMRAATFFEKLICPLIIPFRYMLFRYIHSKSSDLSSVIEVHWK